MIFAISDGMPLERTPPFKNIDLIRSSETAQARFWKCVSKEFHPKDCWIWLGWINDEGYGNFNIGGKIERAHRISYRLNNGRIPEGLCVCHSCDNPSCVNPAHLWTGTDQDNTDDKLRKGRGNHAKGDRNGSRTHPERLKRGDENSSRKNPELLPRGEDHWTAKKPECIAKGEDAGLAKLTEDQVLDIRRLYREGTHSSGMLADQFGLNPCSIYSLLTGGSWKHLPGALERLTKNPAFNVRGERVNTAKITGEQATAIRSEYTQDPLIAAGKRSRVSYALAEKYGISRSGVISILRRKSWAHVP